MKYSVPAPLQTAKWIWPEGGELYLNNCYAQFRCDFNMETVPEQAPFFITADQLYRLSVNGEYVCRGPARGYQNSWPYDEVDLAPFLKSGHNWISVEAHNPGTGTFRYIHKFAAGMICAGDWGKTKIRSCKKDWRMRRSPANRVNVARQSRQLGYQEDFDANLDNLAWVYSEEPPQWTGKEMFRWFGEIPFGHFPWYDLEPRGIPMLREKEILPARISAYGHGPLAEGYAEAFNPVWFWEEKELPGVSRWMRSPAFGARAENGRFRFSVPPQESGTFLAVVLELPAIEIGTFGLEVENGNGTEIIDAFYYQYLPGGIPQDLPPIGYGGLIALSTRLRVAPGFCRRMFCAVQGAKYIVLVIRGALRGLRFASVWRTAEYPFHMSGGLETSDAELDSIYAVCRNTQQICAEDAFMDTPWREQGQWWGDARIQGRNAFFLSGDSLLLKRGIRSIAGQPTAEGLTMGVAPCSSGCILPDFSLAWILTVYDYWMQTGDLSLFREQKKRLEGVLDYFHSSAAQTPEGLLQYDPRFWLFEDWADLQKSGCPAFLNIWHLYTLIRCEALYRADGETLRADGFAEEIAERRERIIRVFYDPESRLMRPEASAASAVPSLHDQVLAVLVNLVPEAHETMVRERILPFLRGEKCEFATPTSFWCNYLFDAAKILGLQREAVAFIRKNWGKMVVSGGTWEHFEWNRYDGQSCCHAWSAHPVSQLPELMLRLRQRSPRWEEFECDPIPELLPESGEFRLPLPQGLFRLRWEKSCFEWTVPAGCRIVNRNERGSM